MLLYIRCKKVVNGRSGVICNQRSFFKEGYSGNVTSMITDEENTTVTNFGCNITVIIREQFDGS